MKNHLSAQVATLDASRGVHEAAMDSLQAMQTAETSAVCELQDRRRQVGHEQGIGWEQSGKTVGILIQNTLRH